MIIFSTPFRCRVDRNRLLPPSSSKLRTSYTQITPIFACIRTSEREKEVTLNSHNTVSCHRTRTLFSQKLCRFAWTEPSWT
jgi:hypothetical protein